MKKLLLFLSLALLFCLNANAQTFTLGTNPVRAITSNFTPAVSDGAALGTASLPWSDLYLASGALISFAGDATLTHSTNSLAFSGAALGYSFDGTVSGTVGSYTSIASTGTISGTVGSYTTLTASGTVTGTVGNYTTVAASGTMSASGYTAIQGINVGEDTFNYYKELNSYSCTVSLVGGSGNVTPVYLTTACAYAKFGNWVWVQVYLSGDGGNEGAGTGNINIALPFTASTINVNEMQQSIGYALNNATEYQIVGAIASGATTIRLRYWSLISATSAITGAEQNNASRLISLGFWYKAQ